MQDIGKKGTCPCQSGTPPPCTEVDGVLKSSFFNISKAKITIVESNPQSNATTALKVEKIEAKICGVTILNQYLLP